MDCDRTWKNSHTKIVGEQSIIAHVGGLIPQPGGSPQSEQAPLRVANRFVGARQAGERFNDWLERAGGAKEVAASLKDLDEFPTPDEGPEYYVDYDETGPYAAVIGESECAT